MREPAFASGPVHAGEMAVHSTISQGGLLKLVVVAEPEGTINVATNVLSSGTGVGIRSDLLKSCLVLSLKRKPRPYECFGEKPPRRVIHLVANP